MIEHLNFVQFIASTSYTCKLQDFQTVRVLQAHAAVPALLHGACFHEFALLKVGREPLGKVSRTFSPTICPDGFSPAKSFRFA